MTPESSNDDCLQELSDFTKKLRLTRQSVDSDNADVVMIARYLDSSKARYAILDAELHEEAELLRRLFGRLGQLLQVPANMGEAVLRKVEAQVKRSARMVIHAKRCQGRNKEQAQQAAIDKASIVVDRYHLRNLTNQMRQDIARILDEEYSKAPA